MKTRRPFGVASFYRCSYTLVLLDLQVHISRIAQLIRLDPMVKLLPHKDVHQAGILKWRQIMIRVIRSRLPLAACVVVSLIAENSFADTLESVLYQAAVRYDCYFTIEVDPLSGKQELDLPLPDSMHGFLRQLSAKLPDDVVTQDPDMSVVIHIKDKKVQQSPLDHEIELTYDGEMWTLPAEMGRLFKDEVLQNVQSGVFGPPYRYDTVGILRVQKRTGSVQTLLAKLTPLSRHDVILWSASTSLANGKPHTALRLGQRGLQDLPFKDRGTHPAEPFRNGILAYAFTPDSKDAEDEALQFIHTELAKPNPLNVRWAMLWLGQWKVTAGIETLIQHIDYQYTSSWLADERYPAVHALEMMGGAAVQPVVDAIQKETKPERLNLLYHSLVVLRMDAHAKPDLQKLKADVQDGDKQKALLAVADALASGSEPFAYVAQEKIVPATQR